VALSPLQTWPNALCSEISAECEKVWQKELFEDGGGSIVKFTRIIRAVIRSALSPTFTDVGDYMHPKQLVSGDAAERRPKS
jgi:hypothetical protein